jgi:uncharacterized protein YndB with AHSA1/START domain
VFGPKQKSFQESVVIAAPANRVWAALLDSQAMLWFIADGVLAARVPGDPEAVGALRCGWQQRSDGSIAVAVHEIVELERDRRVVFLARQRAYLHSQLECQLESHPEGTRVAVSVTQQRQRYDWAMHEASVRLLPSRLANGLRAAVEGTHSPPIDARLLLAGATTDIQEATHHIEIQAPAELIWSLVEDETVFPRPDLERQWRTNDGDVELHFQLRSTSDEGLNCVVSRVLRDARFRRTDLARGFDATDHLIVGADSHELHVSYRWDGHRKFSRDRASAHAEGFLAAVKLKAQTLAGAAAPS